MNNTSIALQQSLKFLLLVFIGMAIYANTFNGSFHFDDYPVIVDHSAQTWDLNPFAFWKDLNYPVRFVGIYSFALNYTFHQLDVRGYHAVNLCIHLINSLLVWWLVLLLIKVKEQGEGRMVFNKQFPYFVALLFLVHPLQTQAVTYISQRFTSLAALFYLLAVCLYLKARSSEPSKGQSIALGAGCFLAGLLGMFTKQTVITLPLIIIFLELFWFNKAKRSAVIPAILMFLIVPAMYSFDIYRLLSMSVPSESHAGDQINVWTYFLTQPRVLVTYLRLLFFPIGQNLDYDFPTTKSIVDPTFGASLVILGGIGLIVWRYRKKYPFIFLGAVWWVVTLIVESSIIPIRHVIFEHRLYLPLLGFALVVVSIITKGINSPRNVLIVFSTAVCLMSLLTYKRNEVWRTELSLWQDVTFKSPQKARGFVNLGIAYAKEGQDDQALINFNKALELRPNMSLAYQNRAKLLAKMGDPRSARADLLKIAQARRLKAKEYFDQAEDYRRGGDMGKAADQYAQALAVDENFLEAYMNLGGAYLSLGDFNLAVQSFNKVISLKADYAPAYNNRGLAYLKTQQIDLAHDDFTLAVLLDPNYIDALFNRGTSYHLKGMLGQGLADLNNVIASRNEFAPAYYRRALILYDLQRFAEAMADARKAEIMGIKINQGFFNALENNLTNEK